MYMVTCTMAGESGPISPPGLITGCNCESSVWDYFVFDAGKRSSEQQHPQALDILAISATSTPIERVLSTFGLVTACKRNWA